VGIVQHAGAIRWFAERFRALLLLSIVSPALATQQSNPPEAVPESISLDVVVGTKSGPTVSGLRRQDFTVLDGKAVVPLDSFQAVLNPGSAMEVVVVIDNLNTSVSNAAYAGSVLRKFLANHGGPLAQPTALAFLTDSGIHTQATFTSERFQTAAVAQVQQVVGSDRDRDALPYVDQPFDQLVRSIPELAALQPSSDQQLLPTILSETATKVDEFFDNTIDLLAEEDITRSILKSNGSIRSSQQLRYNYLIVHHVNGPTIEVEEYRTDANGNRVEQAGLDQGFSFTSGFALICIHFSKDFRSDSRFRYLGREVVGSRNTYVVAFDEKPGQARSVDSASGPWGKVDLLVQGIAWVDQDSSQIVRIRTDLLAPHPEIGLEQQTTEVSFEEIHLLDVPEPLWLPSSVRVDARFQGKNLRNDHRYTNYRRYRVASRMLGPG
jgi:hypothetical protein